jgi:Tfp pilus assembly protein PilF
LVPDEDLEAQTVHTVEMLLIRADAAHGLGQFSNALGFYQRVLGVMPGNIRGMLGVADCEIGLGHYKEAASFYTSLLLNASQSTSSLKLLIQSKAYNDRGMAFQHLNPEV